MKKLLIICGLTAVISAASNLPVSAEMFWKYNDTITIDMGLSRFKKNSEGHEILEFVGIEKLPEDGTCTYTYIYDRTADTIQVKELEKKTKKLHYTSNFTPESIDSSNPVIQARAAMAEAVYQRKVAKNHKK